MTRGTLAVRLAAVPLAVIACAATGAHEAPSRATGGPAADCAAFATAWDSEITPLGQSVISGDRAISIMTDLAATLTTDDPASRAVRGDAQAVVADLENYDGPAAERDALTLEEDAAALLAQCGTAAHPKTA
jgi:hypothetical protein